MTRLRSLALGVSLSWALVGCASASQAQPPLSPAAFQEAATKLAVLEADRSKERTATIRLTLRAPYIPSEVSSRGAVAMRPTDELRMMLLGPGGATAMDVWVRGERFRMEIPALERVVRGDASTPAEARRGLPIGFLRWWLLRPFTGDVRAARDTPRGLEVLLAQDDAWIELLFLADGSIEATRRANGDVETLRATQAGCGRAIYTQASTKLEAVVECESERDGATAKAFDEPCDGEGC